MRNLTSIQGGPCSPQSILAAIDKLCVLADHVDDAAQARVVLKALRRLRSAHREAVFRDALATIRGGRPTSPPVGASEQRALAARPPGARLDDAVGVPVEPQQIRWYASHACHAAEDDPDSGFRLVAHFERLERVWWHVQPAWITYRVFYRRRDHSVFIPGMTRLPDWHAAQRAGKLVPSPVKPGPPRVFPHGEYATSPGLDPVQHWFWGEPCEPPPGQPTDPPAGYPWRVEPVMAGAA